MRNKGFMKKVYKDFGEFVAVAVVRELDFFILEAKYTSNFNYNVKKVMDNLKQEGKDQVSFCVIFNTQGEIAIIDGVLVGNHIAKIYKEKLENYYKGKNLNSIIRATINSQEKVQRDFAILSYKIIYETLHEIYSNITYKKEISLSLKKWYDISDLNSSDIGVILLALLILEDICRYIGIKVNNYRNIVNNFK